MNFLKFSISLPTLHPKTSSVFPQTLRVKYTSQPKCVSLSLITRWPTTDLAWLQTAWSENVTVM